MSDKEIVPIDPKFLPPAEQEFVTDLDYARKNIQELIEKGSHNIDELVQIALQSQHPRAFEVLANYLKTQADLNKDLIEIADKKRVTKETKRNVNNDGTITNNLFVGSTKDLQEFLKLKQQEK